MPETSSRAIRLFGTQEPVEPPRLLRAGPLSAELEAGNLRYIRFGGVEMIRAISYIVRDRNWGTYNPIISNLEIVESFDAFRVAYDAVAQDGTQAFGFHAEISGNAEGLLSFSARGKAKGDFLTNRTGMVILHPIENVAGRAARVQETTGEWRETKFPDFIDPVQPMMNLRAIEHEFAPGVRVECVMEGDAFEMEDQRNWTDASYKTYVRPLAKPWPYTLAHGEETEQSVTLKVVGAPPAQAESEAAIEVRLGETLGPAPALGLGLDPDEAAPTLDHADVLRKLGCSHLILHHDPRRGHEQQTLARGVEAARALGATPWLEAIVAEVEGFEREISRLGEIAVDLGSPFAVVLVSPAADLKSTLPGTIWPPCPPAPALYRAARRAFPGARIGGGMFSFFTELNRKRPPAGELDLVSFTTSPLVHARDDRSVAESLEALPHVARSLRAFIGVTPFAVGPSAIGVRDNPYGQATAPNPGNVRQAMARNDPRQRGLFGAAWNLGYFAHFARAGAEAIALGGATGPFGVLHTPADYPQPGYEDGGLFPVFHVLRGLMRLKGEPMRAVEISSPREVQAWAAGRELWLANLTGERKRIQFATPLFGRLARLDMETFPLAQREADALDQVETSFTGAPLDLDAYAVARLRLA